MSLEDYHKKRDFKETSEPEGKLKITNGKLKFVIQRHAASRLHYDFRLEMEGVLKSWAVPKGPSLNPEDKRLAMMVEDHPFDYRSFEGTIPKGNYGAGEVEIWDEGIYEPISKQKGKSDNEVMVEELASDSLKIVLKGKKLQGEFALVKIKNSKEGNAWLLIKHKDGFATEFYDAEENTDSDSKVTALLEQKRSKKNGTSTDEVKSYHHYSPSLSGAKKLKKFIKPMLSEIGKESFDDQNWAFEIKWDGYRAVADLRNEIQLYSRNGLSFSDSFKKIVNSLKLQDHEMVLDGELVAYDDAGKPNFQWLQNKSDQENVIVLYQVFDLLWLNGHSTQNLSYLQRKELLKDALKETDLIKYHDHVLEKGKDFFEVIEQMELEGMMAKKIDSTYEEGNRSGDWLKIKRLQTQDVLICGYTDPKGGRTKFGSLILGTFLKDELVFSGHAGTGFSDKILNNLHKHFQPLIIDESPFKVVPKTNGKATWLKPELIAEIKFTEITKDHIFRHPVFLRLREDLSIKDLQDERENLVEETEQKKEKTIKLGDNDKVEKLGKQEVKLTNQNKIYFPKEGLSKGDVIEYYQKMATYILPHLKNRPQSMNRFPNGINGLSFYQKDAGEETPDWIETQHVFSESSDKNINYILCNDRAAMAYLNNLGCIDFNVWTSRAETADFPDYLVLDLDPSENNSFDDVIETAKATKKVLDKGKIKGFCKTSGSTGIHIYIPTGAQYTFDQVKDFGHLIMQMVEKKLPEITTLERALLKRDKNKIYLDYLQNRRRQTLASVYSVRPKSGAPVSMPLEWTELKIGLKITDFNIENALERVKKKGDLFKPVLEKGFDMMKALDLLSV
ncbi:DNA ligase D [Chryseobacterium sp. MP_3.2]|uniref:DNA ligase D n=1 Tax=Chryseobacterium sp. MP_3.2 TaxID=3071712 RepID=UPI002E0643F1|nr:bifunctional non-homologous end joining protein LigD [Chryseobacterium sp. MP_3.2]